jgi:hypothetical protein
MGKVTRFHPISLHVIRGAAEYGGFRFGLIHQLNSLPDLLCARYEAVIMQVPEGYQDLALDLLQSALQDCFMDDICVHWVHRTKSGQLRCNLQVQIKVRQLLEEVSQDLEDALQQ